jgi:hypothetical protein
MEAAVLLVTHLSVMGIAYAIGRIRGVKEAQPPRGKNGRFVKR